MSQYFHYQWWNWWTDFHIFTIAPARSVCVFHLCARLDQFQEINQPFEFSIRLTKHFDAKTTKIILYFINYSLLTQLQMYISFIPFEAQRASDSSAVKWISIYTLRLSVEYDLVNHIDMIPNANSFLLKIYLLFVFKKRNFHFVRRFHTKMISIFPFFSEKMISISQNRKIRRRYIAETFGECMQS